MSHFSGGWNYNGQRVKVISQRGNMVTFRVGDQELTLPRSELNKVKQVKNGVPNGSKQNERN